MELFDRRGKILAPLSQELRRDLLEMVYQAGSGHIGGSLSCLEILLACYFSRVFDFTKDKFILSAGHLAPALYVVLAKLGFFPKNQLNTFTAFGSKLQGHGSIEVPGVFYSSGLLGQGFSVAAGWAIGDKKNKIICLTSDGEHDEGQLWEAVMLANKYKVGNLINIVDLNDYQIDGTTAKIMPLGDLAEKYRGFGWRAIETDGHNVAKLISVLEVAKKAEGSPTVIIARTVLGKGIPLIERNYHYHHVRNLSPKLYEQAKRQIQP